MKPVRAEVPASVAAQRLGGRLADCIELTKPGLNSLVVVTSAAGYYLGSAGTIEWPLALPAILGTALVAGGAAVLNQVYERDTDALMIRTRMRPLPDGRILPAEARRLGIVLAACGLGLLAAFATLLASALAALTLFIYLGVYTPMKRRSPHAALVGAIPGALPPLIGWAAARGSADPGGLALFGIVFLWQIPHFMAISWMCRDDYGRAGFPMLSVIEPTGRRTARAAVVYSALLLPFSAVPTMVGLTGAAYLAAAAALGSALLALSVRFARSRTDESARQLFLGTLAYLPLVWMAMILDRRAP